MTLEIFPKRQDLIDMIPDPSDMTPTQLLGGTYGVNEYLQHSSTDKSNSL